MPELKIFGRSWEQIKSMQQGTFVPEKVAPYMPDHHKAVIEADVAKFKIPVAEEVRKAFVMLSC